MRFKAYTKEGKTEGYNFDDPIEFLCTKDDVENNKLRYSAPDYLSETSLLAWKELDNCNFFEKVIYKLNIPKWLLRLAYAVMLLLIGAWFNHLFSN